MQTLAEIRQSIADHAATLGADELDVLEHVASRLVMGAQQYGALVLETDGRDWDKEASEELVDALVYRAALAQQALRRAKRRGAYEQLRDEVCGPDMRLKTALVGGPDGC